MDYEQKYKEALKVIDGLYNVVRYQSSTDALLTSQTLEKAFPELRESEDERIRKEIIQSIQDNMCVIHKDKCIAWLEKQGEQNPAWSEEDESHIGRILSYLEDCKIYNAPLVESIKKEIDWLKLLKPNHWKPSEEQINEVKNAIGITGTNGIVLLSLYNDLKSL